MKKRDGRLRRRIDSVLQAGMGKQILALLACNAVFFALFLFLCGELGYGLAVGGGGEAAGAAADSLSAADRLWFLYNNYIDTGNQVGVPRKERWAALLISLFGSVFVSGLLISTLSNIIERRVERCRSGRVHYRMRDHYVLIGTDAMLPGLILQLFGRDRKCQVVVQTIKDVEEVRRKLFSHLPHAYERRIALCYARRDSLEELEALGVADAREVYILGDSGELDDIEYYHDSLNVDCLNLIGHICRAHGRAAPLRCHLLMEYRSTFSVFQFSGIAPEIKPYIDLRPFNFYEMWARKVFVLGESARPSCTLSGEGAGQQKIHYRPLDYRPIGYESEDFVHLVIIGMSKMGEALAVEAAHVAHFPNFVRDRRKRTRITFVDSRAREGMECFRQAYAALFDLSHSTYLDAASGRAEHSAPLEKYRFLGEDFIDIEWQFVEGRVESDAVRRLLVRWAEEEHALLTLAVCLNLTHQSIATALYLPESLRARGIPVLVQQRITSAIIDNLSAPSGSGGGGGRFAHLRPFGMVGECLTLDGTLDERAMRVNFVYNHAPDVASALAAATAGQAEQEWEALRSGQVVKQWSNLYHASSIPAKLRSLGLCEEDLKALAVLPEEQAQLLAEVEHNRWNVEELLLGYRPFNEAEEAEYEKLKGKSGKAPALSGKSGSGNPQKDYKKRKKEAEFAHSDIREYCQVAPESRLYDVAVSRYLPYIVTGRPQPLAETCKTR